jgi:type III secretory pathway component EscV
VASSLDSRPSDDDDVGAAGWAFDVYEIPGREECSMQSLRRRIEKSGFFLFFAAFFFMAIGITQGIPVLTYAGLAVLVLILGTVLVRSARDVMKPRRRAPVVDTSSTPRTTTRPKNRPATHDPDNY